MPAAPKRSSWDFDRKKNKGEMEDRSRLSTDTSRKKRQMEENEKITIMSALFYYDGLQFSS